jgi:hypothetical protein
MLIMWDKHITTSRLLRIVMLLISSDWLLISSDWEHFSLVVQSRLPRLLSDHFPMLLDCGDFHSVKVTLNLKTCD